jgi:hypothetical protein
MKKLFEELIEHSKRFLEGDTLFNYKYQCKQSLHHHKKQIDDEQKKSQTLWQHIRNAIKYMFNLLDILFSKMVNREVMAENGKAGARFGDRFFPSLDATIIGKAIQAFSDALETLNEDMQPPTGEYSLQL